MMYLDHELLQKDSRKGLLAIGGNQPSSVFVQKIVEKYQPEIICAADHGAEMLVDAHILPDILIGDFDSIDPQTEKYYRDQQVALKTLPRQKDATDTEYALELLLTEGVEEIIILGAFGGRIDHELAVITRICQHQLNPVRLVALSPELALCAVEKGRYCIANQRHYISLVTMDPKGMVISYEGLKYPVKNFHLPFGSARAVSNELEDELAYIDIHSGFGLLMLTEDAKGE